MKKATKTDYKKDQILKAAWNCFVHHGFEKTTMDDIASSIGMKKASLYYYFENKEAIFKEVIEDEIDIFIKLTDYKLTTLTTSTEKLFYIFQSQFEFFRDKIIVLDLSVKLLVGARSIFYEMHKNFVDRKIALIDTVIIEGIKSGEFKDCDHRQVAGLLHALVESLSFNRLQSAGVHSIENINFEKFENKVKYALNTFIYGIRS